MRDKDEYDDLLATSLRNDDVDTFQSIVSNCGENILKEKTCLGHFSIHHQDI